MSSSRTRYGRRVVSSTALGLLLVGAAATPALAESNREKQWYLTAMKAESMWRTSNGEGVTVAVIDSGVELSNPDLQGRILDGLDLAPKEAGDEHTDYEGHGTGMAGLIAGTGARRGGQGLSAWRRAPRSSRFGCRTGARRTTSTVRLNNSTRSLRRRSGSRWTTAPRSSTSLRSSQRLATAHGLSGLRAEEGCADLCFHRK